MGFRQIIISTLMLYQYDESIFDGLVVPNGVDIETVKDSILLETSEYSVIYTNPLLLRSYIKLWSDKNFPVWDELYKTTQYEYNPIHNYDREEHGKDVNTLNRNEKPDITTTDDYTRKLNENTTRDTDVAAFNNGLTDANTETINTDLGENTNNTNKRTGNIKTDEDSTLKHDFHAYGNIGVTSTQELIQQQREIVQFNIVDYIVNDYKKTFCVLCS